MSDRFKGKVALVAGGANADEEKLLGFPGLSALLMARGGASVIIGDIDDANGSQSVKKMQNSGLNATYTHLDVTSEDDWKSAVDVAVSRYGKLDIMIMAAGISDPSMPDATGNSIKIDKLDVDAWRRVMDVTNLGMFLGVRSVVNPMKEVGGGSIVLISSMMAKVVREGSNAYATSRAGMTHFARSAAVQYGPDNIRVNSVLPGWTYTPFTAKRFTEEWMNRMSERIPLGRVARADDIADGILFLASDEARYVTGSELLIDGGVTAWIGPTA
tara:strand:+ start:213 stop:1028 length:816 start_codon:yes stop_codon:yes gene_type:complete